MEDNIIFCLASYFEKSPLFLWSSAFSCESNIHEWVFWQRNATRL